MTNAIWTLKSHFQLLVMSLVPFNILTTPFEYFVKTLVSFLVSF